MAGPIGEPAWVGERLGELRHWERPEMMGQSKCGQHRVTTQAVSPALWVSVADGISWNPRCINVRCLTGDEWIVPLKPSRNLQADHAFVSLTATSTARNSVV